MSVFMGAMVLQVGQPFKKSIESTQDESHKDRYPSQSKIIFVRGDGGIKRNESDKNAEGNT